MIQPLDSLGSRIWITGPSAGGKSTLAAAIGRKLGLPVVHIDRLRFEADRPGWVLRPDAAFEADLAAAAAAESWVMEGNYLSYGETRFERATGHINLSAPRLGNFARYLRRWRGTSRIGGVAVAGDRPNWTMIRWILLQEPRRRLTKRDKIRATGRPVVETNSFADLLDLYAAWELDR